MEVLRVKKYVSDIFDIDEQVKEHGNKIFLIAGVSSGKSTWVKDVLTQKGSVLFVTSRKAKVEEDVNNSCFSEVFKWHTNENQTLITNAKLSALVKRMADNYQTDLDEFIDHFDYIVIDEVHSIATDSTFADSCSGVLTFMEYVANKGKIVVAMTGTPEPIMEYFSDNEWYIVDYRNVCNYAHPKKVILTNRKSAKLKIREYWGEKKVIYFSNTTDAMVTLCKELLEDSNRKPEEIGLIVAKGKKDEFEEKLHAKLKKDITEQLLRTSSEVYDSIINHNVIPEKCKIMFSTSTLREGVDIENEDTVMFCENHIVSNLIQFFGRMRVDDCMVYVIEDVAEHPVNHDELLYDYACSEETKSANQYLKQRIEITGNAFREEEKEHFIKYIMKNPYIYFDYIDNIFKNFHIKFKEEKRLLSNFDWKTELVNHCDTYKIPFVGIADIQGFMREGLHRIFEKQIEVPIEKKTIMLNMFKWAYNIECKQPIGISNELADKGVEFRLLYAKRNTKEGRDSSYWKLVTIEEYEPWRQKIEARKKKRAKKKL